MGIIESGIDAIKNNLQAETYKAQLDAERRTNEILKEEKNKLEGKVELLEQNKKELEERIKQLEKEIEKKTQQPNLIDSGFCSIKEDQKGNKLPGYYCNKCTLPLTEDFLPYIAERTINKYKCTSCGIDISVEGIKESLEYYEQVHKKNN